MLFIKVAFVIVCMTTDDVCDCVQGDISALNVRRDGAQRGVFPCDPVVVTLPYFCFRRLKTVVLILVSCLQCVRFQSLIFI